MTTTKDRARWMRSKQRKLGQARDLRRIGWKGNANRAGAHWTHPDVDEPQTLSGAVSIARSEGVAL